MNGLEIRDRLRGSVPDTAPARANGVERPLRKPVPRPQAAQRARGPLETTVELVAASGIRPEPISWLWDGWLAAGKLHILGGAPGTGKTTLAVAMAATLSLGGRWPDGSKAPIGDVLIWSGEDDPADTLVPRLIAMGADLSRIRFVGDTFDMEGRRPFDPARDMSALAAAATPSTRLLLVDPVVSAVGGDSHKNSETRRCLQPVVDLAARLGCAVLGITHLTKGTTGRDPIERLTGSLAFGALARVVWIAAKTVEGETQGRLFVRAKSCVGPDDGGFEYDLEQVELAQHRGVIASRILWGDAIEGSARDMLATAEEHGDPGERASLDDAISFLRDLLSNGAVPAKKVQAETRDAGFSWRTMERAKTIVGIDSRREAGTWKWALSTPP